MTTSKFVKEIEFKLVGDVKSQLQDLDQTVKNIGKTIKLDQNSEQLKKFKEQVSDLRLAGIFKEDSQEYQKLLAGVSDLNRKQERDKFIEDTQEKLQFLKDMGLGDTKEFKDLKSQLKSSEKEKKQEEALDNLKNKFKEAGQAVKEFGVDKLKDLGKKIQNFFKDLFMDAIKSIKEMISYNSQGLGFTKEARDQQLEWGFSDSENYAVSKLAKEKNLSYEDFISGELNPKQEEYYKKMLAEYSKNYELMKSSGALEKMSDTYEIFEKFKDEFKQTIMKFIVENGDTIMTVLKGLMKAALGILKFVSGIFSAFSDGTEDDSTISNNVNNLINQGVTNNNHTNTFTFNNTINNANRGITNQTQLSQVAGQNGRVLSRIITGRRK